jgi:hypothetical protein
MTRLLSGKEYEALNSDTDNQKWQTLYKTILKNYSYHMPDSVRIKLGQKANIR